MSSQSITTAQGRPGVQAQQTFILCESDRATLTALVDEVERQLAALGGVPTILRYGISPKRRNGFIVVEAARGIPNTFRHWLRDNSRVLDYAVYNVPCYEIQERQVIAEQAAWYPCKLDAPALPVGYTLLAEPTSIDEPGNDIWVGLAQSSDPDEGEGLLVYCEARKLLFLTADEAASMTTYLLEQVGPLLDACTQKYLQAPQHTAHLATIGRALLAVEPEPQGPTTQTSTAAAIQELDVWLARNRYRLIPNEEDDGLRLIPDDEEDEEEGGPRV